MSTTDAGFPGHRRSLDFLGVQADSATKPNSNRLVGLSPISKKKQSTVSLLDNARQSKVKTPQWPRGVPPTGPRPKSFTRLVSPPLYRHISKTFDTNGNQESQSTSSGSTQDAKAFNDSYVCQNKDALTATTNITTNKESMTESRQPSPVSSDPRLRKEQNKDEDRPDVTAANQVSVTSSSKLFEAVLATTITTGTAADSGEHSSTVSVTSGRSSIRTKANICYRCSDEQQLLSATLHQCATCWRKFHESCLKNGASRRYVVYSIRR